MRVRFWSRVGARGGRPWEWGARTSTQWVELRPRSETADLWVVPTWEGKPMMGPWKTSDGRRIVEVIADGNADTLGFAVWFEQLPDSRGTRRGDILWSGGLPHGLVSTRFVDALQDLGVTGWSTYDVTIKDTQGQSIRGYVGLVADVTGTSELVSRAWKAGRQKPVYLATQRVAEGLAAVGVGGLYQEAARKDVPRRRGASSSDAHRRP